MHLSQLTLHSSAGHGEPIAAARHPDALQYWISAGMMQFILLLLLTLAGCGGGGGGGAGGTGGPGPGPDTGPGAQLPESQYTIEQRTIVTGRIAEKYEELIASNNPDRWQALKDFTLAQPEFSQAGIGENLLWAKFTDGRYFTFTDNWKNPASPPTEEPPPETQAMRAPLSKQLAAASSSSSELPSGNNALFLMFNGTEFKESNAEGANGVRTIGLASSALKKRGWNVLPDRALTLDAVRNRGDLGLLYMNSHSATFGEPGQEQFAIIVDDQATLANEIKYADDIKDGSLIYNRKREAFWHDTGLYTPPRYAFTASYIKKYITFTSNSLVVLMMCNAGTAEADKLRQAFHDSGAGTIIAWHGGSNWNGYKALDLLFDRLTSVNVFNPKDPPNRAFHFEDVWTYLQERGVLSHANEDGGTSFIKRFGNGFDLSNPVIAELQVTGNDKMFIRGEFGTVPGSVTIGGTPVASTWVEGSGGTIIAVNLPTGADDPPGSYGDVVVTARSRDSNPRTLMSWRGLVTYTYEDLPWDDASGTLSNTVTVNLHLRADPFAIRKKVDGPLTNNTWNVIPASDTKANWSANGTRSAGGEFFESWAGAGNLAYTYPVAAPTESAFTMHARIDAVERRFQLSPYFTMKPLVAITRHDGNNTTEPLRFPFDSFGFYDPDNLHMFVDHHPFTYGTYIPLNQWMDVPASSQVVDAGDGRRVTVRWSAMTAKPAFNSHGIGR